MKSIKQKLTYLTSIVLAVGALSAIGVGSAMAQEKTAGKGVVKQEPIFTGTVDDFIKLVSQKSGAHFDRLNEGKPVVIDGYFTGYEVITHPMDQRKITGIEFDIAGKFSTEATQHQWILAGYSSNRRFYNITCRTTDVKMEAQVSKISDKQLIRIAGNVLLSGPFNNNRILTLGNCKIL